MGAVSRSGLCLLALASLLCGQRKTFELRGRIDPPLSAAVTLYGNYTPFTARTRADAGGRFRFKKLQPGNYTVSVQDLGRGEVRQSVEISAQLADSRGRVEITVAFRPSAETIKDTATVPARQLSVPEEAFREYERAQEDLSRRDAAAAARRLERAVEIAPQFSAAWNYLGTIHYQSAKYADAERCFRRALEANPEGYSALVNLGGVLLNLSRPREALEYNRRAVRERPGDALANSQFGMNYLMLGDENRAIRYLSEAKRLDPAHFSNPQLTLASIYERRGERAKAAAELEDFLKRRPDVPNAAKLRAEIERLKK